MTVSRTSPTSTAESALNPPVRNSFAIRLTNAWAGFSSSSNSGEYPGYDYWDLGNFDQKGPVKTLYGNRAEPSARILRLCSHVRAVSQFQAAVPFALEVPVSGAPAMTFLLGGTTRPVARDWEPRFLLWSPASRR